jgi:hypothetical protein
MPTPVLTILKLCLLAVLYLFLLRVVRAVWMELRVGTETVPDRPLPGRDKASAARRSTSAPAAAAKPPAPVGKAGRRGRAPATAELRVVEPPERRGTSYPLVTEVTIGRAPGCAVRVDDTFASQLHARVFQRDGRWYVEDLGSTNGTWLNRKRVHGPLPVSKGDRIAVGDTVLELRR